MTEEKFTYLDLPAQEHFLVEIVLVHLDHLVHLVYLDHLVHLVHLDWLQQVVLPIGVSIDDAQGLEKKLQKYRKLLLNRNNNVIILWM